VYDNLVQTDIHSILEQIIIHSLSLADGFTPKKWSNIYIQAYGSCKYTYEIKQKYMEKCWKYLKNAKWGVGEIGRHKGLGWNF
jgi:hypothetical protein